MKTINLLRCSRVFTAAIVLASGAPAAATDAVSVANAWVRATVPGQSVAGAYLDITAHAPALLVAAQSPVAGKVELHTMSMDGGVMKMRALERLDLPAGKIVKLTPGGPHLMLTAIKRQLKAGERVPLALTLRDKKGQQTVLHVEAEVRPTAGAAMDQQKHH